MLSVVYWTTAVQQGALEVQDRKMRELIFVVPFPHPNAALVLRLYN